jgi:hypothetical protein
MLGIRWQYPLMIVPACFLLGLMTIPVAHSQVHGADSWTAASLQGGGMGGGMTGRRVPGAKPEAAPPPSIKPSGDPKKESAPRSPARPTSKQDGAGVATTSKWLEVLLERDLPSLGEPEVVVLTMSGTFQVVTDLSTMPESIQPLTFNTMLKVALDRSPRAIVLAIDSGGGSVDAMEYIIDRCLSVQLAERRRLVAWPRLAGSAAALLTCACKEVVVRSDSKIGAATYIVGPDAAPPPTTALDQKFAAVDAARFRQIGELTGRTATLVEAFRKPNLTVFYKPGPTVQFAASRPKVAGKKPATEEPGWIALDESTDMPLVLTSEDARRCGFASPKPADSIEDLVGVLGLPADTPVVELRLDSAPIRAAINEQAELEHALWETAEELTQPIIDRLSKALSKVRRAMDMPQPKTREEARGYVRAITQARTALPKLSKEEQARIDDALRPMERIAYFSDIELAATELRGAEDLINDAIKHGTMATGAVKQRLESAAELILDAWASLIESGEPE